MQNLTLKNVIQTPSPYILFEFLQMPQFLLCQIAYIVCTKESPDKNHKWIKRTSHNTGPFFAPAMPRRPVYNVIFMLSYF